jgi:hypothetical protein
LEEKLADHVAPFNPQKLALTSPENSGRSVCIVRSRTEDTGLLISYIFSTNLESRTVDEVQKPSNSKWYRPLSEPFRISDVRKSNLAS